MTNYTVEPIKDTAKKDSPIIITKPKKVEEKNEILKPEIIKEKTIEDDINEFKNKEKQATSDADVNNTNPLKRTIDNRLSQGKLTCDTLAGKVFYTIQIGCLSDNFSELYFRNTFKITQRMYLFTYGTQFKYCVGIYKKYVDAIAGLKKLLAETKLPQAYIISYVNGKLVPVSVAKTKSGESRVPFMQVAPVRK